MMFKIATVIFLIVVIVVSLMQRRNAKRQNKVVAKIDKEIAALAPVVQQQHRTRYGRPSTALEHGFPGSTEPPPLKGRSSS